MTLNQFNSLVAIAEKFAPLAAESLKQNLIVSADVGFLHEEADCGLDIEEARQAFDSGKEIYLYATIESFAEGTRPLTDAGRSELNSEYGAIDELRQLWSGSAFKSSVDYNDHVLSFAVKAI